MRGDHRSRFQAVSWLLLLWLCEAALSADPAPRQPTADPFGNLVQAGRYVEAETLGRQQLAFSLQTGHVECVSNWLVDDAAAATIVSYYCTQLAQAEKKETPVDYALALQKAKRWAKQRAEWKNPHFWAPFVLVGPG